MAGTGVASVARGPAPVPDPRALLIPVTLHSVTNTAMP